LQVGGFQGRRREKGRTLDVHGEEKDGMVPSSSHEEEYGPNWGRGPSRGGEERGRSYAKKAFTRICFWPRENQPSNAGKAHGRVTEGRKKQTKKAV